MATAGNLGFPRIGAGRELKWALERHWAGTATAEDLEAVGRTLRQRHWTLQREAGIQHIPVGDFSYYDQVLDTAVMVGAVPARFGWAGGRLSPAAYFAMARGGAPAPGAAPVAALEMTKWFDTNYHYLVPELAAGQAFQLTHNHLLDQYLEARALGIEGRPVLLGPVTFLLLSKVRAGSAQPLELLPALLPVYAAILGQLRAAGAGWVQVDEPCLALDLPVAALEALTRTYQELSAAAPELRLLLATYFGGLGANLGTVCELPVAGLHIDAVRAADEVPRVLEALPDHTILSLGLVDGRNVWRTDLPAALATLEAAEARLGADRVQVAPSCSLLHVPLTVAAEMQLDPAVRSWLAFATEKLDEVASLAQATQDRPAVEGRLAAAAAAAAQRRDSAAVHDPKVVARLAAVTPADLRRARPYDERGPVQAAALGLPELPTTTIGSFPQTGELRQARARLRRGELTPEGYDAVVAAAIAAVIEFQEALGLDVLVHGEPERTDMVEFFAAQLAGFAVTTGGWVQSYGSRCVRPPIIYGDVSRPRPMTVRWAEYAQSRTHRPVKGMLTGPVTILQWAFVRDDQPRATTAGQIALALRDEVADLERAGIRVIQVDEPALREGLPLRRAEQPGYLRWAVDAFRLVTAGVADATQIHTHMCYSEFNDILGAIREMDADVLAIESSRSQMELLGVFRRDGYPNAVGPGIWDIHSPRVPSAEEMADLLERACQVLRPEQVWVNPDCGLKTRAWAEVEPALRNMVAAAREVARRRAALPV